MQQHRCTSGCIAIKEGFFLTSKCVSGTLEGRGQRHV